MKTFSIATFYKFFSWPESLDLIQEAENLEIWCVSQNLLGLIIMGPEGINATISGETEAEVLKLKIKLENLAQCGELHFKFSSSPIRSFKRMRVKHKTEIVTLGDPSIRPEAKINSHLTPEEWKQSLTEDAVVIDVRNEFEIELGRFKGALDLKMQEFTEFPEIIKNSKINKDQKVLMYCTGGIRCEKASIEMKRQGYKNVYQLKGGILEYIKEFPNTDFEGECFVFDHRVALDQKLQPTKTKFLCPHCGQPGEGKGFGCLHCKSESQVCKKCLKLGEVKEDQSLKTCSKNCRHHYNRVQDLKTKTESHL